MFISPLIVYALGAIVALAVLVALIFVMRAAGRQKSLKFLALLLIAYPAVLVLIKIFDLFEVWVWILILLAATLWFLSGREFASRKQAHHTRLEETPATPKPAIDWSSPPPAPKTANPPAPAS